MNFQQILDYLGANLEKILGVSILIALIFLLSYIGLEYGMLRWIYSSLSEFLENNLGFNKYIIIILSLFFTVAFGIYGLKWFLQILIPFQKKGKREEAAIKLFFTILTFICFTYFITVPYIFLPSGDSNACYAATPNGYELIDCNKKVHPQYGTPVIYVDKEMGMVIEQLKGESLKRINPDQDYRFFAPNGVPMVWYSISGEGIIKLFNLPGHDPQTNDILHEITPDIVSKYLQQTMPHSSTINPNEQTSTTSIASSNSYSGSTGNSNRSEDVGAEFIFNHSFLNRPQSQEVIVSIVNSDDKLDHSFSQQVSNIYAKKGYTSIVSIFSGSFYSSGKFNEIYSGNQDLMKKMGLYKYADAIAIGRLNITKEQSSIDNSMTTATATLELKLMSVTNGASQQSIQKTVAGTGWSEQAAKENALNNLISILNNLL